MTTPRHILGVLALLALCLSRPAYPAAQDPPLVAGNRDFAVRLYQQLSAQPGNLFFSPHSISTALAMTYAGARGETERQMAQTLGFTLPQAQLHPAFAALDAALARPLPPDPRGGEPFTLHTANALWGSADEPFLPAFLSTLAENYRAGLRKTDFARPEEARRTINQWASDETRGKIENLIPPGIITPATPLVLTNAIYFKASWEHPFQERATQPAPFTLLDGTQVSVPTMRLSTRLGYTAAFGYAGASWQAVELPYQGGAFSMVLFLPQHGQLRTFEKGLTAARLQSMLTALQPAQVQLAMPKFRFDSPFLLKPTLSALGMPLAFSPGADFRGLSSQPPLWIGEVVHKAFVGVDEKGTEAAAATAVAMARLAPSRPVALDLNRPFVFLIRHTQTGEILFLGRVVDPR